MITSRDKELIIRLVGKYSAKVSTDKLLAYIADNTGMMAVCQLLVRKNNENDRDVISWLDEQCYQKKVDVRNFLYEIEQVLAIFQPEHEDDTHYRTLGLEAGAGDEEIKEAYRKLSRRYHPDTSQSDDPADAEMFIRINTAYNALENRSERAAKSFSSAAPAYWRQEEKKTHQVSAAKKKKNIFWFSALTFAMIVVSILAARGYQKKAMITGLRLQQAAFIPPDATSQEDEDQVPVADVPIMEEPAVAIGSAPVGKADKNVLQREVEQDQESGHSEPVQVVEVVVSVDEGSVIEEPEHVEDTAGSEPEVATVASSLEEGGRGEQLGTLTAVSVMEEKVYPRKTQAVKPEELAEKPEKSTPHLVKKEKKVVTVQPKDIERREPSSQELHAKMQQRIEGFLQKYTEAYKSKNLRIFHSFFDEYTTENGKPIAEVLPTYVDLFKSASSIDLSISVLKWWNSGGTIHLDGRFTIRIRYKTGKKIKGSGGITFVLKDLTSGFLVKEMTYQFDK